MKLSKSQIIFKCHICQRECWSWKNWLARTDRHFCGEKCRLYWRNYINNPDNMPHVKKFFADTYLNDGNPKWRGGCAVWLRKKLESEGKIYSVCQYCKKPATNNNPLHMHHLDKNRRRNVMSNIRFLCPSCHKHADLYHIVDVGETKQVFD